MGGNEPNGNNQRWFGQERIDTDTVHPEKYQKMKLNTNILSLHFYRFINCWQLNYP